MEATFVRKAMDQGKDMADKSMKQMKDMADKGMKQMDKMAKPIHRTAEKIPPSVYVAVGLECCVASTILALAGQRRWAAMVGGWGTCSLLLGIYSKLQREHGN